MSEAHEIYVGDKIERAVKIIGEESDKYEKWELMRKHTEGELNLEIEERHNYLYVQVKE